MQSLKDEHKENISFTSVRPVNVKVREVTVEVEVRGKGKAGDLEAGGEGRKKCILDGISADFPSGSLCGIMGGSGSGKTTLLNIMAHRTHLVKDLSGSVSYNGSGSLASISHAYVTQMDLLLPTLTVRETLLYAASLRLTSNVSAAERLTLVEEIILELGLKECADTRVGDGASHGGCSGGERRRVSIGVQMLSNPSVLFCDEPTTGLDATSAYHVISTLKSLASKGRTIICTIHQPRHDIFYLFDNILLLSKGYPLFSGPTSEATDWFERLLPGSFSKHLNPADYLIMVAAVDTRSPEAKAATSARLASLAQAWKSESAVRFSEDKADDRSAITDIAPVARSASVFRQIRVLSSRSILTTWRDPMGLTACWSEAILMGVICGLVFLSLGRDLPGIRSRQASLYIACALQPYLILIYETWRLTGPDLAVFDRERGEGVIDVIPWIISRRLSHGILEDIIVPFMFSTIFWFMCGFDADALQFFKFFAAMLINQFIAVSAALFCAGISRDFSLATLVGNLGFTFLSFSSGFFIQPGDMPVYVGWIRWISYCFYTFGALMTNEFTGNYYDCPLGDAATNPNCLQYRGDFILESFTLTPGWYTVPMCALVGFVVFFTIASTSLLQFKKVDVHMAAVYKGKEDEAPALSKEKDKEPIIHSRSNSKLGIDLDLIDIKLTLKKLGIKGKWILRPILRGVNTQFQAGEVNVIMGPSGSGKSSLLNFLSSRLPVSSGYFVTSGTILVDGTKAEPEDLQGLCSLRDPGR
ncbi:ATP-binding cassette transporter snq2 [Paramarasmius palmivorus]|uniref:ATP-binding cassette transporter snq2 n=1 Tax=Paramarasmius palmivorus TaxID=297713 RepID=A0AAW0BMW1_9AGAR